MKRQSFLRRIPNGKIGLWLGGRALDPRRVTYTTHWNKSKRYPYMSKRQRNRYAGRS